MLVLSRSAGESITVDGPAEVYLLRVKGNRVAFGVRAPGSTNVVRTELVDKIVDLAGDVTAQITKGGAS